MPYLIDFLLELAVQALFALLAVWWARRSSGRHADSSTDADDGVRFLFV